MLKCWSKSDENNPTGPPPMTATFVLIMDLYTVNLIKIFVKNNKIIIGYELNQSNLKLWKHKLYTKNKKYKLNESHHFDWKRLKLEFIIFFF